MTTTPSGWYDDGHGTMRWWDGAQWTEHVAKPSGDVSGEAAPRDAEVVTAPETGAAPGTVYPGLDSAASGGLGTPPPGAAPTEPAKSKLWIVWVVLGVVVLGALVAAAVLIPLLITWASGQVGQSGGATAADADQEAAVATVASYDEAWQDADCDGYFATTTESFRTQSGLADCSAFETEAEAFSAAVEDYEIAVTDVREEDGEILVATTETYTLLVGEDGAPLDEPTEDSIDWLYVVVPDGDDWVIDDMQ